MQPLLEARNLSRVFGKEGFVAVSDVSLTVAPGEVLALVGPNGAGKTTTVKMCSTLLTPSAGTLVINGVDAIRHPRQARAGLGLALGGDSGFYPRATARDNLLFFADVAEVRRSERKREVQAVLERVGLADRATSVVGEFSRGMKQRLHIARALLGSPGLLLDEPTSGLDPESALDIRDLIAGLVENGTGVLLTSHSMDEVEELSNRIAVIGAGKIIVSGNVGDIAQYAGIQATTTATFPARAVRMRDELERSVGSDGDMRMRAKGMDWSVTVHWNANSESGVERLLTILDEAGLERPADLLTRPANLEDAYLAISDRLQR